MEWSGPSSLNIHSEFTNHRIMPSLHYSDIAYLLMEGVFVLVSSLSALYLIFCPHNFYLTHCGVELLCIRDTNNLIMIYRHHFPVLLLLVGSSRLPF